MFLLSLLFLLVIPLAESQMQNATVNTKSGTIVGFIYNFKGIPLTVFLGIPFAKPPVGDLRFKKPQPIKPWSKPLMASRFRPACVQHYPFYYPWADKYSEQSEDCLHLNIWAPIQKSCKKDKKAVMFWIYSGGFSVGSNSKPVYDGRVLTAYGDVIVVTVNYRLGIFGFLSLGTEDAPGNMGFFDVLIALKWVNENIEAFGGDKNRITVFGHSAGSFISAILTVAPLAKGLFQKIIMESGAPFPLAGYTDVYNLNVTHYTAAAVGCSVKATLLKTNPSTVVECLRKIDAFYLAEKVNSLDPANIITFFPISGDEFLPVDPIVAIKTGLFQDLDVEILAGNVQDDGSFAFVSKFPDLCGPYGEKTPKINKTLGRQLILKLLEPVPFKYQAADHYLSCVNEYDYDTVRARTYHSVGDLVLICNTIYFVESFSSKKGKTYLYYYYHQTSNTVFAPWMGVTHFTEVQFVFGRPSDSPQNIYTPEEYELSINMMKMWTNFAKTGVPSAEWKEYSKQERYIQKIYVNGTDESTLDEHLDNCEFYRPYVLSP